MSARTCGHTNEAFGTDRWGRAGRPIARSPAPAAAAARITDPGALRISRPDGCVNQTKPAMMEPHVGRRGVARLAPPLAPLGDERGCLTTGHASPKALCYA